MSTHFSTQSEVYFRAKSLGPEVLAVLTEKLGGRVIAVLRDAVYLESDGGLIIGIVGGEIDGPLTLRVDEVAPLLRALKTQPDATFHATKEMLHIAGIASIEWTRAAAWEATLPQTLGPYDARMRAIHALAGAIADVGPREGCSSAVVQFVEALRARPQSRHISLAGKARRINPRATSTKPAYAGWHRGRYRSASEGRLRIGSPHIYVPGGVENPPNPISARIEASLSKAYATIQIQNWPEAAASLTTLIGLGPGLTPSGDDMVAGITASLVWRERLGTAPFELSYALVDAVRQMAPTRTNRISARLLLHACEGVLYSPAMDLGAALLSGDVDAILQNAKQLFSIGHTTGIDLASGLLFGSILNGKLAR